MRSIIILLMMILVGCISSKETDPVELAYRDIVDRMAKELNKLGDWEYSPDGKDSLWQKTDATHNLNLLDSVLANIVPLDREWDSLMFLSRKYDTVPLPSELVIVRWDLVNDRKIFLLGYRPTLKKLVDQGIYSREGKQVRDLLEEMRNVE